MHSSTILLSFWLLTWNVHLAVSFTVCPTKTRSFPKELHPVGFGHPSSPASCILFVFPLPAVVSSPALRALLIPELHLPGWKRSATGSSATSPHAFPPLELMGNAAFPPSLLPPPPSSPAPSCTAPCKIPTGEDLERGGEQALLISLCAFPAGCLFLRAGALPPERGMLGTR